MGFRIVGRLVLRDCGIGPSSRMLAFIGMAFHRGLTETQVGGEEQFIHISTAAKPRLRCGSQDFPGGPGVKTVPSNAGGTGSIPSQGTKVP